MTDICLSCPAALICVGEFVGLVIGYRCKECGQYYILLPMNTKKKLVNSRRITETVTREIEVNCGCPQIDAIHNTPGAERLDISCMRCKKEDESG